MIPSRTGAKRKHQQGREYVARMRACIRKCERMIAEGARWPGESEPTEQEEACVK